MTDFKPQIHCKYTFLEIKNHLNEQTAAAGNSLSPVCQRLSANCAGARTPPPVVTDSDWFKHNSWTKRKGLLRFDQLPEDLREEETAGKQWWERETGARCHRADLVSCVGCMGGGGQTMSYFTSHHHPKMDFFWSQRWGRDCSDLCTKTK